MSKDYTIDMHVVYSCTQTQFWRSEIRDTVLPSIIFLSRLKKVLIKSQNETIITGS